MIHPTTINRRQFAGRVTAAAAAVELLNQNVFADPPLDKDFQLNFMLASCMYGHIYLGDILPEVRKTDATAIDLWPRTHGSQREQLDVIGEERFLAMIAEHDVTAGCMTRFDLGNGTEPTLLRLQDELKLAGRLGCNCVVTAGHGPRGLRGAELKAAVKRFIDKLKPTIEIAEANGVRLAIENHGNNLIESPDSLKWLAELTPSPNLAIAFAPYHLPQDAKMLGELIEALGPAIALFYAWQHGMGCMTKMPKQQELMQMPGRGDLDFKPLLAALKKTGFNGWTEIFMHPVPRGIPILESEALVTQEINQARRYLEKQIA